MTIPADRRTRLTRELSAARAYVGHLLAAARSGGRGQSAAQLRTALVRARARVAYLESQLKQQEKR